MSKIIEFIPSTLEVELVVPKPKPAKSYVPQWYKNGDAVNDTNFDEKGILITSVKQCIPFLDAMTAGYIQETWCDIHIHINDQGLVDYHYSSKPTPLKMRDYPAVPLDDRYHDGEFIWQTPWIPKLPKGYSILFTQPFNNFQLPFQCASGIVDADDFYHAPNGNFPFYLAKGFNGIIPAGTPMYQMIPIKRDDWKSKSSKYNEKDMFKRFATKNKTFINAYRNNFWTKKNYN